MGLSGGCKSFIVLIVYRFAQYHSHSQCFSLQEPTPDPVHLVHVQEDEPLVWGYPDGYPTVSLFLPASVISAYFILLHYIFFSVVKTINTHILSFYFFFNLISLTRYTWLM